MHQPNREWPLRSQTTPWPQANNNTHISSTTIDFNNLIGGNRNPSNNHRKQSNQYSFSDSHTKPIPRPPNRTPNKTIPNPKHIYTTATYTNITICLQGIPNTRTHHWTTQWKFSWYDQIQTKKSQTAWKNILDQHNKAFVKLWFCFQFPLNMKAPKQLTPTPKHQHKLHRKSIRELTWKIKDIKYYLTESLKDFNKAKKHREKPEQWQEQYVIDNKQHKERKIFQHQAEAETSTTYNTPKYMTAVKKALQLEKECKDTKRKGEEFAKW